MKQLVVRFFACACVALSVASAATPLFPAA
jgi:hypothetical protein